MSLLKFESLRVLNRHRMVFARTWLHNLMFNVAEPLLYLSAFGFGLGLLVGPIDGYSYLQYIAPGMIALSAMYSATFECTYGTFLRFHYQKTLQAILAGPVTAEAVVWAELLFGTFKSILFGAIILLIVGLLGYIPSTIALLIPLFLFLPGLIFANLAVIYTCRISNIDQLNYYVTLAITPFFLFGGLYFPVSSLPAWIQRANWLNPLFHSIEICRSLAWGLPPTSILPHLAILIMANILLTPISIRLLKNKLLQ